MKKLRMFIKDTSLKKLQAISDDSYLYNCIVNNYTELDEDNIFRNPDILKRIGQMFYLSKNNITDDDLIVWNETNYHLKDKDISYYVVIIDEDNEACFVYNNLKDTIPILGISYNSVDSDSINKIESFNNEIMSEIETEMEV